MKITFIRPSITPGRSWDAMEPLAFAFLAAVTPPEVELELQDERLAPVRYDEPTDLAAISVETYTARRAYQHAVALRRRGVPVVLGGHHPSLRPEEALQFADAVVIGDGEASWPTVVGDARAGRLRRVYRDEVPPPLSGPPPDRRIFAGKRYAPTGLVQFGRGCQYACEFCSVRALYGPSQRQRPVAAVAEEIASLGRSHVLLVDDNLFVDPDRTRALLEALVPLRVRWSCQTSLGVAADRSLLRLMARAGCMSAIVGFESLDRGNLEQMNKRINLRHLDYDAAVHAFHDHGIMVYGTFVFGYDNDTPAAFDRCLEFAVRAKLFLANFNPLTPMPGSPLYDRLATEGRLLFPRWWLEAGYRYGQATFRPRGMTPEELTAGCYRARREFNRAWSITRRALDRRANCRDPFRLGVYLLANTISRREIRSKQGRPLGGPDALAVPAEVP